MSRLLVTRALLRAAPYQLVMYEKANPKLSRLFDHSKLDRSILEDAEELHAWLELELRKWENTQWDKTDPFCVNTHKIAELLDLDDMTLKPMRLLGILCSLHSLNMACDEVDNPLSEYDAIELTASLPGLEDVSKLDEPFSTEGLLRQTGLVQSCVASRSDFPSSWSKSARGFPQRVLLLTDGIDEPLSNDFNRVADSTLEIADVEHQATGFQRKTVISAYEKKRL